MAVKCVPGGMCLFTVRSGQQTSPTLLVLPCPYPAKCSRLLRPDNQLTPITCRLDRTHKPYPAYTTVGINSDVTDETKATNWDIARVGLSPLQGLVVRSLLLVCPGQRLEERNQGVQVKRDVQPWRER
jgi:hypothetical protein